METTPAAPPIEPFVTALAPGSEQGGTVLVAGATAAARRAWVARVLGALADARRPAPVVVRVGPRGAAGAGATLEDELSAAAERALREVGAPGGLYDDPRGGALASLGGWLFRARAARRHGVVLLVEEVDGWLEARGAAGGLDVAGPQPDARDARERTPPAAPYADPTALAIVRAALEEAAHRPVSLLATARASDAAGTPALPAELVARFAQRAALGGAPVVARDPSVLVAALAGRSFSLGAIKHALAGWLELPPDAGDETAVVFTSPLAPPPLGAPAPDDAVGADGTAAGEAPLEWARGERGLDASSAQSSSSQASPSGSPASGPAGGPSGAAAPGTARPLGAGWNDAVRAALEVREAIRALADATGAPRGHRQFERIFRDAASRLPLALAALRRGEAALGLPPTRVHAEGTAALARFERAFSDYYPEAFDAWTAGSPRPLMLCDLPGRLARAAAERSARGTALVVVTGLRFDAFARLRARVLPQVRGLTLLEEGTLWAARPTNPSVQRELLARGLVALAAALPRRDEPVPPRSLDEALRPRREHLGHTEVLRLDAYATELLRSELPLDEALARVEAALPAALSALCAGLTTRTLVALAGDVGLRELARRPDDPERGRYAFGGDSPFEVLVPFAVLAWG